MAYIVVRRKAAKSSTKEAQRTSKPSSSVQRPLPKKPKTTSPRAVRIYNSGRRLVVRFFVVEKRGNYFVADALTWETADGTEPSGYRKKEEAVSIAREYRDTYGAYCKSPF